MGASKKGSKKAKKDLPAFSGQRYKPLKCNPVPHVKDIGIRYKPLKITSYRIDAPPQPTPRWYDAEKENIKAFKQEHDLLMYKIEMMQISLDMVSSSVNNYAQQNQDLKKQLRLVQDQVDQLTVDNLNFIDLQKNNTLPPLVYDYNFNKKN